MEERGSLKRDIAIEVKGLSYIYSRGLPYEKEALTSVSIKIFKGEAVGIVGHTGSGKSTLIQHFNGLILPQVGTVKVFGEEIKNDKKFLKELRRRVGLVFQFPESQLFAETVYDDIAFGPRNLKLPEDEVKERVMWAINEVGLTSEYLDRSPFSLSGG
ncbi:MAG TPA: ATP-binding cassette domain-containing protein, partial [Firmicutes bacterium]|nr:ATP-binding cassette domain-containing protein [Bacillota bacterium]